MVQASTEAERLKALGNEAYSAGKLADAVQCYTAALQQKDCTQDLKQTLHRNRALCQLKKHSYEDAIADASTVLHSNNSDKKALYYRASANVEVGNLERGLDDLRRLIALEPNNPAATALMDRVKAINAQNKYDDIIKEIKKDDISLADAETVGQQILPICHNDGLSAKFQSAGGIEVLTDSLKREPFGNFAPYALRGLRALLEQSSCRESVLDTVSVDSLLSGIREGKNGESATVAYEFTLQAYLLGWVACGRSPVALQGPIKELTNMAENAVQDSGKNSMACIASCTSKEKLVPLFYNFNTILAVMKQAEVGDSTLRHTLAFILFRLHGPANELDKEEEFLDHIRYCLGRVKEDAENGQLDAGAKFLRMLDVGIQGLPAVNTSLYDTTMVINVMKNLMAGGEEEDKSLIAETLSHAVSKDKSRTSVFLGEAGDLLKVLINDENEAIRSRALIALSKLSSLAEGDPSKQLLSGDVNQQLEQSAVDLLIRHHQNSVKEDEDPKNRSDDAAARRWALEALAYLSMDGDVKERLIDQTEVISALQRFSVENDGAQKYAIGMLLLNLTNASESEIGKSEEEEQVQQLRKFAGEQVVEKGPADDPAKINARIDRLMQMHLVSILYNLSLDVSSENMKQMLALILHRVARQPEHRGYLVQQGGTRALLTLLHSSEAKETQTCVAQALAKVCISMDPNVAFPNGRTLDLIRPLLTLLNIENHRLLQFEGLMALTNLASLSDELRKKILAENGLPLCENLQLDEDPKIQTAATEALCNLLIDDTVVERYLQQSKAADPPSSSKIHLWLLFSGAEEVEMARAASGGVAMLSGIKEGAVLVGADPRTLETIIGLIQSDSADLQHRGLYILRNVLVADNTFASSFLDQQGLEMLLAVQQLLKDRDDIQGLIQQSLDALVNHGLIQPNLQNTSLTKE
eukprot:Clim_evm51s55 gene=Clim_evmTU51s55